MIRKIVGHEDKEFTHRYLSDVVRIKQILLSKGYDADLRDCACLWDDYSDTMAAGWMGLGSDEEVWEILESSVIRVTTVSFVR